MSDEAIKNEKPTNEKVQKIEEVAQKVVEGEIKKEATDKKIVKTDVGNQDGQNKCPKCGSGNWDDEYKEINHIKYRKFKCNDCGHKWKEETI